MSMVTPVSPRAVRKAVMEWIVTLPPVALGQTEIELIVLLNNLLLI